jgi:hypothetical protein
MSIIREKHVKIRVTQKCWGCGERFPKGATLLSSTYTDDDGIYSLLLCEVCEEYDERNPLPRSDVDGRPDFKNHDPEGWESAKARINNN